MTVTAVPLQPVKRSYLVWLWIGIAVLVAGAFLLARQGDDYWAKSQRGWIGTDPAIKTTASGLQYKILTPGTGPRPTDADVALINYEGKLRSGVTFDKSQSFPMPVARVVPGFSEGLKLMSKGAKFRFWLPAKTAYGAQDQRDRAGNVVIPGNSPLMFDVELIAFMPQTTFDQYQMMMGGGAGGAPGAGGPPGGAAPPPGM
jgi:FKBP-type peptidyl-prolyl cis-trans isomerase FkpA